MQLISKNQSLAMPGGQEESYPVLRKWDNHMYLTNKTSDCHDYRFLYNTGHL